MAIDKDKLEKALSKKSEEKKDPETEPKESKKFQMSKEQEIWFHQGALNTLINERNELFKMVQNIEAVMQAHIKRLEELGIKIKIGKKE